MSLPMHLLRPRRDPMQVAKGFATFCKEQSVITRNYVKVGRTPRGLRGLVATRDIAANDNVVVVSNKAMLSVFDACRSADFREVLGGPNADFPLTPLTINGRVGSTFLHYHQVVLGFYMAHMILADKYDTEPFVRYIEYLPRGEGNFQELTMILERALDHCDIATHLAARLAHVHVLSPGEVKQLAMWCITMVISRAIPVEHKDTLLRLMEETDFVDLLEKEPKMTQYSLPVMCPVIDMINHAAEENVAIVVPDTDMQHSRAVIARSLRKINAGEEITMQYGNCDQYLLRVFYGIDAPAGAVGGALPQ